VKSEGSGQNIEVDNFGSLVSTIGEDATFLMIEEFGGMRLYIPQSPKEDSRIAKVIGLEKSKQLAAKFGHETIRMPLAKAWRIQVYRTRGLSISGISRMVGLAECSVSRHLASMGMTTPRTRDKSTMIAVARNASATSLPIHPFRIQLKKKGDGGDLPLFPDKAGGETVPKTDPTRGV
jgi:hypothetical protein